MANIRGTSSEEPAPTGVCTSLNALAFSTLLSSQETDAHLRRNVRSPPGQPSNHTLEFPSCQLRFRKLSGRLRSGTVVPPDTKSQLRQPGGHCGHTRNLRKLILGGSPGPRLPCGNPSPRGKMNFTAGAHRRQIEDGTRHHPCSSLPSPIPVLTHPDRFVASVSNPPRPIRCLCGSRGLTRATGVTSPEPAAPRVRDTGSCAGAHRCEPTEASVHLAPIGHDPEPCPDELTGCPLSYCPGPG
jgi:hypothetical protein